MHLIITLFFQLLIFNKLAYCYETAEGYILTPYSNWTKICERNCSEPLGLQARFRKCLYCNNIDCIEVSHDKCEFLGKTIDTRPCYEGTC
jgi:hypothetical protein